MTQWVLEAGLGQYHEQALTNSIILAGGSVVSAKFIPFAHELEVIEPLHAGAIFHGSIEGAIAAKALGLKVWADFPKYHCAHYYPRLNSLLLNRDYEFTLWGEFRTCPDWLWDTYGECVFVRPASGCKPFTGTVVYRKLFQKDTEFINRYGRLKDNELLVTASKQDIAREWRFLVSQGRVITGSLYRTRSDSTYESADLLTLDIAQNIADSVHRNYDPESLWIMDLCRTGDGGIFILEVGAFSSSGLYAMDTDSVVITAEGC